MDNFKNISKKSQKHHFTSSQTPEMPLKDLVHTIPTNYFSTTPTPTPTPTATPYILTNLPTPVQNKTPDKIPSSNTTSNPNSTLTLTSKKNIKNMKKIIDLPNMTYFIQNQKINQMENMYFEYKHFTCPTILDQQYEILAKLINGYINTQGGNAFIGIDNCGMARGRKFTKQEREEFKSRIKKIIKGFYPKPNSDIVKISFLPIRTGKTKLDIEDMWIVKIKVNQGDSTELYCTSEGKSYMRLDGQTRKNTPEEYQEELKKRKGMISSSESDSNESKKSISPPHESTSNDFSGWHSEIEFNTPYQGGQEPYMGTQNMNMNYGMIPEMNYNNMNYNMVYQQNFIPGYNGMVFNKEFEYNFPSSGYQEYMNTNPS